MSNEVAVQKKNLMSLVDQKHLAAIEKALAENDLSYLTSEQRVAYYNACCESVGLNPLTQPFAYIKLNGKITLYARKECSEQLRKINLVSTQILSQQQVGDFFDVHVRASDKTGRIEEDFASVSIKGLNGNDLANAKMKAITKAKRRVTLAITGLGIVDESELETIDNKQPESNPQVQNAFDRARDVSSEEKSINTSAAIEGHKTESAQIEASGDAGEYVIKFGKKYSGKKIKEVLPHEHESMLKWLYTEQEKGNFKTAAANDYIKHAEEYLSQDGVRKEEPLFDESEELK